MNVDIADAKPEKQMLVNEVKNFSICSDAGLRQLLQGAQDEMPLPQTA